MTEQQIKELCKFAIENGKRPFTREQKEILKQAIENAESLEELLLIAFSTLNVK